MLHKEFWGLVFLAFVVWIFMASTPPKRIEHFCAPVTWTGNVATSGTALVLPDQQTTVQKWFDKGEYGCEYVTWRLFYQAEYNAWMQSQGLAPASATPAPTIPVSPIEPTTTPPTDKPVKDTK